MTSLNRAQLALFKAFGVALREVGVAEGVAHNGCVSGVGQLPCKRLSTDAIQSRCSCSSCVAVNRNILSAR